MSMLPGILRVREGSEGACSDVLRTFALQYFHTSGAEVLQGQNKWGVAEGNDAILAGQTHLGAADAVTGQSALRTRTPKRRLTRAGWFSSLEQVFKSYTHGYSGSWANAVQRFT